MFYYIIRGKIMKKIVAYILAWMFYYIGNIVSKSFSWTLWSSENKIKYYIFDILYNLYNTSMDWSVQLQEWGELPDNQPWHHVTEEERELKLKELKDEEDSDIR